MTNSRKKRNKPKHLGRKASFISLAVILRCQADELDWMDKYSSCIWYAADGGGGGGGALSNIILEPDALNYRFMAETVFVHKSRNVHVVTILPGTI